MNSGPDHSVIKRKTKGGIVILRVVLNQPDVEHIPTHQMMEQFVIVQERRGNFVVSAAFVLNFEDYMNPALLWLCNLAGHCLP